MLLVNLLKILINIFFISEDESDLFMFRAIVNILVERYVQNIGDVAKLPLKTVKQFNADTGESIISFKININIIIFSVFIGCLTRLKS